MIGKPSHYPHLVFDSRYSAGSQDHCGLLFPGINKLNYTGQHFPSSHINLNDPSDPEQAKIFQWLERVLHIVEIPLQARPGDFNSQAINNLTDENVPRKERVAMVKALSNAAELAWQSILKMDSSALGKALTDTMHAWEAMLPYTVDPWGPLCGNDEAKGLQLRNFWSEFVAGGGKGAQGCLFTGAGGGFLMVISENPIDGAMKIVLNHDAICKPFPSDKLDSKPHPIAFG